ncbi:hypothetical protein [Cyanobium sp. Cruz-8H5]|uniref:hypothetical protein n=1 Tax=Cyanobium sp. Cruz-8H5 TaxID=2823712 RepID=UPI0020CF4C93|nr:hypothetical protein [Cyanobium sp. Cruz-8H5]
MPADAHVFLQDHSRFVFSDLPRPYRGLHLIRDPRDVLISGAHYHGRSGEAWLHVRQARLLGRSYQQAIRGCRSLADAIAFEMRHEGGRTIREMLSWTYSNPLILEVKYEAIAGGEGMKCMADIFSFLGYSQDALPELLAIVRGVSIFRGGADCLGHVRDGRAKQWAQVFDERLKALFIGCFDDALIRLGYEVNHDW